jgi:hypothetical protein
VSCCCGPEVAGTHIKTKRLIDNLKVSFPGFCMLVFHCFRVSGGLQGAWFGFRHLTSDQNSDRVKYQTRMPYQTANYGKILNLNFEALITILILGSQCGAQIAS